MVYVKSLFTFSLSNKPRNWSIVDTAPCSADVAEAALTVAGIDCYAI